MPAAAAQEKSTFRWKRTKTLPIAVALACLGVALALKVLDWLGLSDMTEGLGISVIGAVGPIDSYLQGLLRRRGAIAATATDHLGHEAYGYSVVRVVIYVGCALVALNQFAGFYFGFMGTVLGGYDMEEAIVAGGVALPAISLILGVSAGAWIGVHAKARPYLALMAAAALAALLNASFNYAVARELMQEAYGDAVLPVMLGGALFLAAVWTVSGALGILVGRRRRLYRALQAAMQTLPREEQIELARAVTAEVETRRNQPLAEDESPPTAVSTTPVGVATTTP